MDKQTYMQMERDLIALANNHRASYVNHLYDFDDIPYFSVMAHNVPTLADMCMLAEKYGFEDCIDSNASWGYVALDLSFHEFEDEDGLIEFINNLKN